MTHRPNRNVGIQAARGLRKQVKLLAEHLGGVRLGEDTECIHRVRVASRRLRAVLATFGDCWKRKHVKNWKKEIRRLARDLGAARDFDVQIEFLVAKLAEVSDAALVPGIARLLSHVEQQRQCLQPRVLKAVNRIERSGVLEAMQGTARRAIDASDGQRVALGRNARRRGVKCVGKRLKELLAEAPGLQSAECHRQHHAMRIAVKRFRYTLELVRPRRSAELDAVTEIVKRLQSLLGEIHDCDVWAENLDTFARAETAQIQVYFGESRQFNRLLPGLDYLSSDRKSRREQAFGELVAFWQELTAKRVWERLTEMLECDSPGEATDNGAGETASTSK